MVRWGRSDLSCHRKNNVWSEVWSDGEDQISVDTGRIMSGVRCGQMRKIRSQLTQEE